MKKQKLKQIGKQILLVTMIVTLGANFTSIANATENVDLVYKQKGVELLESSGWVESINVEWQAIEGATGYNVYYKAATAYDSEYEMLDNELIRQYPGYFRADILGLAEGEYVVKIVPIIDQQEVLEAQVITEELQVQSHVREGFAFSKESPMKTGSGGYNDDGSVSENAEIIYITAENVNNVQADVIINSKGGTSVGSGLADILTKRGKGYDKRPLIIRMIGEINRTDIEGLNSSGYLQIKGNYNVTFEGIGEDATVNGWGFLIRSSRNIELRNVGIMLFPDDAISLDTDNQNIWVHNNDIFYGAAGSDADQVKGDGSADVKGKSTYVTISYNHFYDSGKVSLCGMSDVDEFFVTYHHNWFDHSDSRHPRIRVGSVHIYNNYFDGNSKYGVGVTKGSSAFVEANDFRNCKYPMLSSLQGSDIYGNSKGNFSGEAGGMIKAYNNSIVGATRLTYAENNSTQFDAYLATEREDKVPSSYKTVSGGSTYNNFDTSSIMYEYTPHALEEVSDNVTFYAGRVNGGDFKWQFTNGDDSSYSVNTKLMNAIKNYENKLISVGGNSGTVNPPVEPEPPVSPEPPVEPDPEPPVNPEPPITPPEVELTELATHNFTTDNKDSLFFKIQGNLSTIKGTATYKELILTQVLKIDSAASINFTTNHESTLTLVFNEDFNKNIIIDGIKNVAKNGIVNVDISAGSHTITKGDTSNLFYIELLSK